jgi:hypothetical protein
MKPAEMRSTFPRALIVCLAFCLAAVALAPASSWAARRPSGPYPAGATRASFTLRSGQLANQRARAASRAPAKQRKPALSGDPARALLGFQAMQHNYYILGSGLYKGEPFSYLWPFSQALAATVTADEVPVLRLQLQRELKARMIGLGDYFDGDNSGAPEGTFTSAQAAFDGAVAPPAGPGGTKYYDDNDWVGLELVRLYRLTHERAALNLAEQIMAFEMAGWQASPELGCPGGIPFSNSPQNSERNTITTAPAAELGVRLYAFTGNAAYLQFAEQAYAWVRTCLLLPSGLYGDHVNKRGIVEPRLWSYTQGVMIGAGTLLYQATGNPEYLTQAAQTVQAAGAYFTPSRLGGEIPFFPSIYFRNLMYYEAVTQTSGARSQAQSYVDYFWAHLRTSSDLFVYGSPPSGQLLVQAAIVQIYGLLSSSPSTYF